MTTWTYDIGGTDADGTPWRFAGAIAGTDAHDIFAQAMRAVFLSLTGGKAEFGNPGKACRGPYSVTRILIKREEP